MSRKMGRFLVADLSVSSQKNLVEIFPERLTCTAVHVKVGGRPSVIHVTPAQLEEELSRSVENQERRICKPILPEP